MCLKRNQDLISLAKIADAEFKRHGFNPERQKGLFSPNKKISLGKSINFSSDNNSKESN